jgi:hypothetical protein
VRYRTEVERDPVQIVCASAGDAAWARRTAERQSGFLHKAWSPNLACPLDQTGASLARLAFFLWVTAARITDPTGAVWRIELTGPRWPD